MSDVRRRALDRLNEHNISTTLVVTLKKGLNDDEIGDLIDFALKQKCVRGITFQPIQIAGRLEAFDPEKDRLTLGEIRQNILSQSSVFKPADVIPVPCHPDCLAMAYALKINGSVVPLTGLIDPKVLLHGEGNTIVYERDPRLRAELFKLFSTAASPQSSELSLRQLLCCLPQVAAPSAVTYDNIFRIIIMQFLDAWNFDVRSVKKTCVHIAHPDGRIIPFDTYNLFYRDGKSGRLAELQAMHDGMRDRLTPISIGERIVDDEEPPLPPTLDYAVVPVPRQGGAVGPFFAGAFLGAGGIAGAFFILAGVVGNPLWVLVPVLAAAILINFWITRMRRRLGPFYLGLLTGAVFVPILLIGVCFVALSNSNI